MDETTRDQGDAAPGNAPESEVAQEFRRLGENLQDILRTAWESPERKKLQSEIKVGLAELETSLNKAATEFRESPTGQRLKTEVENLGERVRSGEVEGRLRTDLLSLLRQLNIRLEEASEPGPQADADTDPTEA